MSGRRKTGGHEYRSSRGARSTVASDNVATSARSSGRSGGSTHALSVAHSAPAASSSGERLMGLLGRAGREAFMSPTNEGGVRAEWADIVSPEESAPVPVLPRASDGDTGGGSLSSRSPARLSYAVETKRSLPSKSVSLPLMAPPRPQIAVPHFAHSTLPTATRSAPQGLLMVEAAADAAEFLTTISTPSTIEWTNVPPLPPPPQALLGGGRPPRAASSALPPTSTDAWNSSRNQPFNGGHTDASSCGSMSPGSDRSSLPGNIRVFVGKLSAASNSASVKLHFEDFFEASEHPLGRLAVLEIFMPPAEPIRDDVMNKWRPNTAHAHRGFAFLSLADTQAVSLIASVSHVVDGRPAVIDAVAPRGTRFTNRGRLNSSGASSTVVAVQALAEQQAPFYSADAERSSALTPMQSLTPANASPHPPHCFPLPQAAQYFHPSPLPPAQLHPSAALSSAIALLGFLPLSTQSQLVGSFYMSVVEHFAGMQAELAQQNQRGGSP